jgi:hypothetical protein
MKKPCLAVVVISPLWFSTAALAQSQIQSGINNAIPYFVGIGSALSTVGLIYCGIKFQSGDPAAKEHLKGVLVGAVLILTASVLTGLLRSWFS